ncbi:MAG: cyclic-di-AMP receptor [Clostridia bacterium]|nr:cyclic-di-AMP receptor [Clostridia bacterium]
MKLIFAIINNDDGPIVSAELIKEGFHVTKMASTGGFLKKGNNTFITAVEDEQVDTVIDIIKKYSKKRKYTAPVDIISSATLGGSMTPIEVTIGGATVFVANIERFERV